MRDKIIRYILKKIYTLTSTQVFISSSISGKVHMNRKSIIIDSKIGELSGDGFIIAYNSEIGSINKGFINLGNNIIGEK